MPTINDYFNYAETALGSYAVGLTLGQGHIANYKLAGMTTLQAEKFDASWSVLGQQDLSDGFSAVLLEQMNSNGTPSGQKVLAIRGTEGSHWGIDYLTDILNIGGFGSNVGMQQYNSLESFYKSLITQRKLTVNEQLTVTGHSLGGFLAEAFTAEHDNVVSAAYTYNAPGFGAGDLANYATQLLEMFGLTDASIPNNKIVNVRALGGLSVTSGLGQMIGFVQPIIFENADGIFPSDLIHNHSIVPLTDALSLYAALSQLDASLTPEQIGGFLKSASVYNNRTLESILDALRRSLMGDTVTATPIGNRDTFYTNLQNLQSSAVFTNLAGKVTVTVSTGISVAQARSNFGAFLALSTLSPFVLSPSDTTATVQLKSANEPLSQAWEADAQLTPAQRTNGQAHYSDLWLADRAAMLGWLNVSGTQDQLSLDSPDDNTYVFTDVASKRNVQLADTVLGVQIQETARFIRFGGDNVDTLKGDNEIDHLYGGAGADNLIGLRGNDYLEGGTGNDLYKFSSGDGNDQIVDGDGGTLIRNGKATSAGYRSGVNEWKGKDGTTYTKSGSHLIISFGGGTNADQITIKDFDFTAAQTEGAEINASNFGIALKSAKLALLPTLDPRNNPAQGGGDIAPTSTTLKEGGLRQMTLFASGSSDTDRTVTLSLPGDASHYLISTGADLLNFQNGKVQLTLAAGEDSVSFALLTQGDLDTNASLTLNASLGDGSGGELTDASIDIAFTAGVEAEAQSRTDITDDGRASYISRAGVVNPFESNPAPVSGNVATRIQGNTGNDLIYGLNDSGQGDLAFGGDGNDILTPGFANAYAVAAGNDIKLDGGAGDDLLDAGDSRGELHGGDGNDLLEGNVGRRITIDYAVTQGTTNAVPGDSSYFKPAGVTWLDFVSPWLHLKQRTQATVSSAAGSVTATGGSWAADSSGNWRIDPSVQWSAYNDGAGTHPQGQSPTLFEDTSGSGSFITTAGQTIDYTVTVSNDRLLVSYNATVEKSGFPTQTWTAGAALTSEVFGVIAANSRPHTLDGGEGDDALIGGDGGPDAQGNQTGETLIGGAGNDLIQFIRDKSTKPPRPVSSNDPSWRNAA